MTPALLLMADTLGPAAAEAGDLSGPVRLADSVLAARNHTGATRPCQGEWLWRPPTCQVPQLPLFPSAASPIAFTVLSAGTCSPVTPPHLSSRLMVTAGPIQLWALGGQS